MENTQSGLLSKSKAKIGDIILFTRKQNNFEGKVFIVRDTSVLVEISKESAKTLGYEMPNTVVRHGNYIIKGHGV